MLSVAAALLFCAANPQFALTDTVFLGQQASPLEWSMNGRYLLFTENRAGESVRQSRERVRTGQQSRGRLAVKRYDAETGQTTTLVSLEETAFLSGGAFVGADGDALVSSFTLPNETGGAAVTQLWFAAKGGTATRVGDPIVSSSPARFTASKVRPVALVVILNSNVLEVAAIGADSTRQLTCLKGWQAGTVTYPTSKGTFAMAVSRPGQNGETESAVLEVDPAANTAVPLDPETVRPESSTQKSIVEYDRVPLPGFGQAPSYRLIARPKEAGAGALPVVSGIAGTVVPNPDGLRVAAVTEVGLIVRELVRVADKQQ